MNHGTKISAVDDTRISVQEIPSPKEIIQVTPLNSQDIDAISEARKRVTNIIHGKDHRILAITWPCSIHDTKAAMQYAEWLLWEKKRLQWELEIVMRVYFEKPRTTVGWKWLINDPYLDGTNNISEWLLKARQLLRDIVRLWLPVAVEFLDVISPQYIADLVTWWAIWARTTESQVHRELASWLSCPLGFKNGTDGNIQIAIDAMLSASSKHSFLWTTKEWKVAIVHSEWNSDTHVILRGGSGGPNYDIHSVQDISMRLEKTNANQSIMIDLSHANSNKDHKKQLISWESVAQQINSGNMKIMGVMIESNLEEGRQNHIPWKDSSNNLIYWKSITDACIGLEDTKRLLDMFANAVQRRNKILTHI